MTTAQRVYQTILNLPEEQQQRVLAFAESLPGAPQATLADPYGTLASSDLDLSDFQQARAASWARFPRELPD
jgi:hypothetical protein